MRIALLVLGVMLLLQTVVHVIFALVEGPISFTTVGMQIDEDLVRLTAGLCAVSLARRTKSQSRRPL